MIASDEKNTELTEREPTIEDVRRGIRSGEFEYITLHEAEVLHAIACGEGWAMVIGHPDWASYEWVYVECSGKHFIKPSRFEPRKQADEQWEHSNCGYGGSVGALRDALTHAEGLSCGKCGCCMLAEDVDIQCHRCTEQGAA